MIQILNASNDALLFVEFKDAAGYPLDFGTINEASFSLRTPLTKDEDRPVLSLERYDQVNHLLRVASSELQQMVSGDLYIDVKLSVSDTEYPDHSYDVEDSINTNIYLNNTGIETIPDEDQDASKYFQMYYQKLYDDLSDELASKSKLIADNSDFIADLQAKDKLHDASISTNTLNINNLNTKLVNVKSELEGNITRQVSALQTLEDGKIEQINTIVSKKAENADMLTQKDRIDSIIVDINTIKNDYLMAKDLAQLKDKDTLLNNKIEDNYQYAENTYTKKKDSEITDVSVRLLKSSVDLLYTELSNVSTTAKRADTNAKNIEDILLPTKIDKGGIKTINGQSLEGSGNIEIMPGGDPVDLTDYAKKSDIPTFKTINGEEITGTGNIEIKSGGSDYRAGEGINIKDNVISSAFFKRGTGENSIQIIDANNHASGLYSLVLGTDSTASGICSYAEGSITKAQGNYSHAEGVGTTASNSSEHASGQYNISHHASDNFGDAGNTLFSVGNGFNSNGDFVYQNAFEIRQNGDIYITDSFEGTPYKLQDKLGQVGTGYTIVKLTSAEYAALEEKQPNVLYAITD